MEVRSLDKEILELVRKSETGDKMTEFKEKHFPFLDKEILEPMRQGAFNAFLSLAPSDTESITQAQQAAKVVDKIRKEIDAKIQEGILANQLIMQSSNPIMAED